MDPICRQLAELLEKNLPFTFRTVLDGEGALVAIDDRPTCASELKKLS